MNHSSSNRVAVPPAAGEVPDVSSTIAPIEIWEIENRIQAQRAVWEQNTFGSNTINAIYDIAEDLHDASEADLQSLCAELFTGNPKDIGVVRAIWALRPGEFGWLQAWANMAPT